ncbi:hypothetical protein [Acrocarpospora sp. B8E8]|uniref:hypothetical protein n=1 Tax=Acrocarpospora sp. B8E8 TaxID=3153572 RepID=UPI00325EBF3C
MDTRSRYATARKYLTPDDLSELTGPSEGIVKLPIHLDWSEQGIYDLSDDRQTGLMYERVIREAASVDDLRIYLNAATLCRLWGRLYLPIQARQVWEARFRALTRAA